MCDYTGQNDPTRTTAAEWKEGEYAKALAKITTAQFTSLDAGMPPYEPEERSSPQVRAEFYFYLFKSLIPIELWS